MGKDLPSSSQLCNPLNDLSKWNQTFPYFNIYSQRMKSKFLSTSARPTTFCSPPPFQCHLQAVPSMPGTFTCLDNFLPTLPLPGRFSYLTWQIPTHSPTSNTVCHLLRVVVPSCPLQAEILGTFGFPTALFTLLFYSPHRCVILFMSSS